MRTGFRTVGKRRRTVWVGLLSALILAALAWKAGLRWEEIESQVRRLNWALLAGTLVFSAAWHMLLGADKWWRILRALGADVGFGEVFRVRLGSDPIRFAMPLKAGEVVNAAYFAKHEGFNFSRAAGSVVFDKSLNFFGTVFWLYVGMAAIVQLPAAGYLALHTAMAAGVIVLFCVRPVRRAATLAAGRLHPRLGRFAAGVLSAFEEFTPARKVFFLLYGVVFQLRPLAVCWLVLAAFRLDRLPALDELLALGSVVVLMSNIPSLGGIGPREATLMAVFADYASPPTLLSVGLLMSFAVQVFPALLGIPWMFPLLRSMAPQVEATLDTSASLEIPPRDVCEIP
jgi:hypothetical protein